MFTVNISGPGARELPRSGKESRRLLGVRGQQLIPEQSLPPALPPASVSARAAFGTLGSTCGTLKCCAVHPLGPDSSLLAPGDPPHLHPGCGAGLSSPALSPAPRCPLLPADQAPDKGCGFTKGGVFTKGLVSAQENVVYLIDRRNGNGKQCYLLR